MALLFANHTVSVYARNETPNSATKVVPVPVESAGVPLTVQIQAQTATVSFDSQTGAELVNPYRMFVEPEDVLSVPYGARVLWNETGYQFRVTTKAMLHKGGGELAELDYALAEMELLEAHA